MINARNSINRDLDLPTGPSKNPDLVHQERPLFDEVRASSSGTATIDRFSDGLIFTTNFPIIPPLLVSQNSRGSNESFGVPEIPGTTDLETIQDGIFHSEMIGTLNNLVPVNGITPSQALSRWMTKPADLNEIPSTSADVKHKEENSEVLTHQSISTTCPSLLNKGLQNTISTETEDSHVVYTSHICAPATKVSPRNQESVNQNLIRFNDEVEKVTKHRNFHSEDSIHKQFFFNHAKLPEANSEKRAGLKDLRSEVIRLLKSTAEITVLFSSSVRENENLKQIHEQKKEELNSVLSKK